MPTIHDLPTPALLLDLDVLEGNLDRMAARADALGVALRPHFKTHKCVEVARLQRERGARGGTVSTLHEARTFIDHGSDDLTWAFPVIPSRISEAVELARRATLRFTVDTPEAVDALEGEAAGAQLHAWLEVDPDGDRSGVDPTGDRALELARRIAASDALVFDGLLTHASRHYHGTSPEAIARMAEEERAAMVGLAERLRKAGAEVPAVSVGSTPGMTQVERLDGVTEVRPGNYAFFDHTQVMLGSCTPAECAVTVLATVVSRQPGAGHCVVDAGALALSKDAGPGRGPTTMGEIYADYDAGRLRTDARVVRMSQEHGVVEGPPQVGERLRILPNHSCLTVACFDEYGVVRGEDVVDRWRIWRGRD